LLDDLNVTWVSETNWIEELISGANRKSYVLEYTEVLGDNMNATTIKIHGDTKQDLDKFREYRNESYGDLIRKMICVAKKVKTQPELGKETIESIERARK
jgi:hypothetical protein